MSTTSEPPSGRRPSGHAGGRGRRRRRTATGWGTLGAGAALAVVLVVVFVVLPSPSPGRPTADKRTLAAHPPGTTTTLPPATTTTTTTDPGTLPQTDAFPSSDTPQFDMEMSALWAGVVTGSVQDALPAFFPETAYVQLKAIADPAGDWEDRLVAEFSEDLAAAHGLLGPDGSTATLLEVDVPAQYGHWVPPGVCENGVGYYEVPNSRVVYQEDGQTRSFGIASMISWRGEWYVVHLGAVLPSSDQGVVDDPESGPGTSAASSTC
jgi:hypothetical protein